MEVAFVLQQLLRIDVTEKGSLVLVNVGHASTHNAMRRVPVHGSNHNLIWQRHHVNSAPVLHAAA